MKINASMTTVGDVVVLDLFARGYAVSVTSDDRYFTIRKHGAPIGTLQRPRARDELWQVFDLDGEKVGRGIGPRTAFRAFIKALEDTPPF